MATLTIDVPDTIVVDLGRALARYLGVAEPTTNAQRVAIARSFMRQEARRVLIDYRANAAADALRNNPADPAVAWE